MKTLKNEIKQNELRLAYQVSYRKSLEEQFNQIINSKFYKIWQKLNSIKKIPKKISKIISNLIVSIAYFFTTLIFFLFTSLLKFILFIFSKKIESKNIATNIDGVSFIIPTWNKKDLTIRCIKLLDNILADEKTNIKKEIIIIENGSSDGSARALENLTTINPLKILKQKTNLGFARAVNLGVQNSKYNYIYLLNNDMEVQRNFFVNLINYAQDLITHDKLFLGISSQIFFYEKTKRREESGKTAIQPNCGLVNVFHYISSDVLNQNSYTLYPGGGSSLLNKNLFNILGGYDYKSYAPLYCEDLDLGFNAWKFGVPSYYCTNSHVIHHHRSSSSSLNRDPNYYMYKNLTIFCLKNFDSLQNVLKHVFLYPLIIFKNNNHKKYAVSVLLNIKNIFISKIWLYRYKQVYSDRSLINFPLFESLL